MNIISRIVQAAYNEAVKPKTFVKGDEFENFLRQIIFPSSNYDLLNKTHGYNENKDDFVESSKNPDYLFRDQKSGQEFYVEAKYRSTFYRQGIEWCKEYQLLRYQVIDRETPVLVAIGVAGTALKPERVFLFPVRGVRYTRLFPSFLKKYEISPACVSPERFNQLVTRNDARNSARDKV